ncbi:hypothetical protein [Lacticaseibacillus pantheris]|uniref:hypothetical protein n=1 Tax=Lacticaseibacillus pantheris TaxID=171523 RepID=UPI0006CF48E3|nr:hypothetical protein [Lacticaseibacillus pantheris]
MDINRSALGMVYATAKDIQDIDPDSVTRVLKRVPGQPGKFNGLKYLTPIGLAKQYAEQIASTLDEATGGRLSTDLHEHQSRPDTSDANILDLIQTALETAQDGVEREAPATLLAAQDLLDMATGRISALLSSKSGKKQLAAGGVVTIPSRKAQR